MKYSWIIYLALVIAALAGGLFLGRKTVKPVEIVEIQRDTVEYHDTLVYEKPVPKYITKVMTDTVRLALVDTSHTLVIKDSVNVEVPIERKVYEDSTFRAVVSGYKPNLDSLWVYRTIREITITNTVKIPPKHFGFGVSLGPTMLVTPKGDIKGGLGITGGITYKF